MLNRDGLTLCEVNSVNYAALRCLIESPPYLHSERDFDPTAAGDLISWGIQSSFLRFMAEVLTPESLTLETGSGLSTVCFAIIGSEHLCVSPATQEHERIQAYCRENQISTDRIRFVSMRSQAYLPTLDLGGRKLDFALMDGSHAFPNSIIDYYYINENLGVGGLLAVDDLAIPAVGILHKFLITEPAYQLVKFDSAKTGLYRKVAETLYPNDWPDQRINRPYPDLSYLPLPLRVWQSMKNIPSPKNHAMFRKVYRVARKWVPWK